MNAWKILVILSLCLCMTNDAASKAVSARKAKLLRRLVKQLRNLQNNKVRKDNENGPGQTSQDDDPAIEEEKLENKSTNGGALLDQKNIDPDSTLAKMIEGMKVELHGKEKTPKGQHPQNDQKQREDSIDGHKYTPLQRAIKRNFAVDTSIYWEEGIIPYSIASPLNTGNHKAVIEKAISEINKKTCLRIVPKGSQDTQKLGHRAYIEFVSEDGCWSYVGRMSDDEQKISLNKNGCVTHAITIHELLHAMGMEHEQSRADRDKNIKIITENVDPKGLSQFGKVKTSDTRPYDYQSVMQYSLWSYGKLDKNGFSKQTMKLPDQNLEFLADLDAGLDFYDVADITDAYRCTAKCTSKPACQNGGFVDHNCKCYCPTGLKGDLCEQVESAGTCGGIVEVSTTTQKVITSPNWPNKYNAGTKCVWLIKAPSGQSVNLNIDEMDLPYNDDWRCYHWLEVRYNLLGQLGPKRCGSDYGISYKATPSGNPNYMMVIFDAKFSGNKEPLKGFKATASAISGSG